MVVNEKKNYDDEEGRKKKRMKYLHIHEAGQLTLSQFLSSHSPPCIPQRAESMLINLLTGGTSSEHMGSGVTGLTVQTEPSCAL